MAKQPNPAPTESRKPNPPPAPPWKQRASDDRVCNHAMFGTVLARLWAGGGFLSQLEWRRWALADPDAEEHTHDFTLVGVIPEKDKALWMCRTCDYEQEGLVIPPYPQFPCKRMRTAPC